MRNISRTFILCTLSAALMGTTVSSARAQGFLTNGLVGYFPFNGNANDASGNTNDGIVAGPVLMADRLGVSSSAYGFSVSGDKITTANANGFPLSTSDFAVSLWVSVASASGTHQVFLCNGATEQFQIHIGPLQSGTTQIGFQTGGTGAGATPAIPWTLNHWYNVQVVRFQNTITIYRDGVQLSQQVTANGNDAPVEKQSIIMGYRPVPEQQFYGMLDDVRIYNRALSASEVQQLYVFESVPRINLIKAVKPSFDNLWIGANYQLQVSGDLNNWTNQGAAFTATNNSMIYPQYFDANWGSLYFRLQAAP